MAIFKQKYGFFKIYSNFLLLKFGRLPHKNGYNSLMLHPTNMPNPAKCLEKMRLNTYFFQKNRRMALFCYTKFFKKIAFFEIFFKICFLKPIYLRALVENFKSLAFTVFELYKNKESDCYRRKYIIYILSLIFYNL